MALLAAVGLLGASAGAQSRAGHEVAVGDLLVAAAQVPDPRFAHAVVLVVAHSDQGTAGLVLNRPGTTSLAQLFAGIRAAAGRREVAFAGGPVEPARVFCLLHVAGRLREARRVLPEVYFGTSRALMELAFNAQQPASSFRVFQGYAGWTAAQLARELAAGRWTIVAGAAATVFDPAPATLWARLAR